jgi:hypothetical protein
MRWLVCFIACACLLQGAEKKPLDPSNIFDWRTPQSPQISPDGTFVVS